MQLGMIGLGRMGANMVRRLMRGGHQCVVYDRSAEAVASLASNGAVSSASLESFVSSLARPRLVWMMLPAAVVDSTIDALLPLLEDGDA
ncbi:MAG: NAD(P)-binding domain-containing protein, partial [Gemmatimonadaceae bacterium]